ncbi:hypothetical protein H632_c3278p0 [Helicosporidium sp. ATCC 50920]|nr:hypothetical protein H632_c3278p0 [Helicosporidium sp. ATCC 50920]|eukprot:KDD72491.1 hypothetical protein H632_c3278p0 [Helicosporidium sp. ATCC 50920]
MGPGVAGVLLREEMRAAAVSDRMEDALADLERLKEAGQAMVALAQGLRARQQPGDAMEGSGEALDASTASSLVEFGMLLPTDAGLRGKELARALARQLSEFLRPHLTAAGGLLTLTDAYCLFCRARGVDLVTPDDMVRAVDALGEIPGGIRSRTLRSGVKILHAEDLGGDSVAGAILDLLSARRATEEEEGGEAERALPHRGQIFGSPVAASPSASEGLGRPVTAQDVAAALSIPLALAAEHLEDVEARGILCRDESLQGVCFYRNFFVQGV